MSDKKLIFIVDDDPFILKLLSKRLSDDDHDVKSFSYGEDCINSIEMNPDLIILDYLFQHKGKDKVMNGKEIFSIIRKFNESIPVIILSGQDDGDVVLEMARMGIEDYVIKDESLVDNLLEVIKEIF